ncbi:NADAR family protein [Psychroserpens luteus]|uniref:NADAR family protein n=1 Tax=Psychroserpens luteus TaxID=1434066 RepID=A0ABW5ZTX0_9FLAO|nr:NADAR family protein [Psychroserpens luteus]
MKYTIKSIQNTGKPIKYLLFWGHQKSKDGSITKSCFSQWWEAYFKVDGILYKTAEHYMMAEKAKLFNDGEIFQKVIVSKSPAAAKKLGRQVKDFNQQLWEDQRFEIVKKANYFKFSQNPELKDFLLKTKKRILVEASPVDKIWGIGLASDHNDSEIPSKWKGLNLLGFALMEVRDELLNEKITN